MPTIHFVHPDGRTSAVAAAPGQSVMEAGTTAGIDEIVAQCGGSQVCATCHVFVDDGDFQAVGSPGPLEEDLLDTTAAPRRPNSRLSCQITIADRDLTIHLPERQL